MKALTVTASILFGVLLLVVALLAVFPGSNTGDPVVSVAVSPAPPPPKQAPRLQPTPSPAMPPATDLPPGFGIAPQPQKAPGGSGAPPQQQAGPAPPAGPTAAETHLTAAVPPPPANTTPLPPPESESAQIALASVPVPELVENSQYGPLPKVADDGKRAVDVYARPSRYAGKAPAGAPPRIAVLIDGLGMSAAETGAILKGLPAPVSVAYSAYGRNLQDWVQRARADGHEVLLQIPLEPADYPTNDPGPHTLLTTLPPEENMKRLQWLMSRITGYVGVTNLMGAKFDLSQDSLVPVFEELKARGVLYLDDGTARSAAAAQPPAKTAGSNAASAPQGPVGEKIANSIGLDYGSADVQIDALPAAGDIDKALAQLETLAKERGVAIGVASAKPATVKQLAQWAGQLESKGFVLIPISAAVRSQRQS